MDITEKKLTYAEENQVFDFKQSFSNGIKLHSLVVFESDKFLDYQKDLIQEFIADFSDVLDNETYDENDIKTSFESYLQNLNTKLKVFADKVRDVDYFPIKGYFQIIVDGLLISSMIGDINVMIFRNRKLYYSLHNSVSNKGKIDLFSDFVEGDIEDEDEIIYAGTKVSDVLDDNDIKEMETILASNEDSSLIDFIKEVLTSRVDTANIGLLAHFVISNSALSSFHKHATTSKKGKSKRRRGRNAKVSLKIKDKLLSNKYNASVAFLSIVILFMLYHVLSQILHTTNDDVFVTGSGVVVDVTIEDIKKDIYMFQSMDPTSDGKGTKYYEILQKLNVLENKGRWLEDIAQLKKILQADYHKGFNIIYLTDLAQFDDPSTDQKTQLLAFNTVEKEKLGTIKSIDVWKNMFIAGSEGALIGSMNDGLRGSLIEYGIDEQVQSCNMTLMKDGLYCSTKDGNIFAATKAGIETVTTTSPEGFPANIAGVATYGKANIYLFQPTLTSLGERVLLTRYRNVLGSQTQFQEGQNYLLSQGAYSGTDFGSGFASFSIDATFLAWSKGAKKILQFWRDPASSLLDVREVPIMGGDKVTNQYSDNVKITAHVDSKYVYLFDKDNQTFTVYESRPLKTNEQFTTQYNLYYLFRYAFDLEGDKVVDITIPEASGNRPEMYILTQNRVHKVRLYEFIDSIKDDNVLKNIRN